MRRIYFAGSIRGGRADAELYRRMIARMQETDLVLTEHIGNPELSPFEQIPGQDREIYSQDTEWLRSPDLVIAECTTPSLGVGYELAYAEARGIPCYIFYNASRTSLSAMLTGDPYFNICPYSGEEELMARLAEILNA